MKKLLLLLTLLSLFAFMHTAWGQARPTNEERLIRVEEGVKHLDKRIDGLEISLNKRFDDLRAEMNSRFAEMNSRLDDIKNFMLWGFGILFSGMFILVGFILWDRRTTLAPVVKETKYNQAEIEETKRKQRALIDALNKYAEDDPKLKELLNKAALF